MGILSDYNHAYEEASIHAGEYSNPPLGEYQAVLMKIEVGQSPRDGTPIIDFAFHSVSHGVLFRKRHFLDSNNMSMLKSDLVRVGIDVPRLDMIEREDVRSTAQGKIFNMKVFDNQAKSGKVYRNIWIQSEVEQAANAASHHAPPFVPPESAKHGGPEFAGEFSGGDIADEFNGAPFGF